MTSRIVYFDLASGAGGDMLIAATVHAARRSGDDIESAVADAIDGLGLRCSVAFADVERGGIASLHASVVTDGTSYTAGQMRDALAGTKASDGAKSRALRVLDLLLDAEAAVHGVGVDEVHLHELGSADTPADAIGAAAALDALGVEAVAAAAVPVTSGWVSAAHGQLPVPAPATLEVLRGAVLRGENATGELVTPTAAAILVSHDCAFGSMPPMTLEAVGTGAGTKERDVPNICRAFIGTPVDIAREPVVQLDANIDDQTPEGVAHAVERLLAAGALDAWVTPIVMKKSRPAFQLSVLTRPEDESLLVDVVFRETTTLGLRRRETSRWVADREEIVVRVAGQCIRVKVARLRGEAVGASPEFEDCVRAAEASGLPFKDVYAQASDAASTALA